jgi:hypothetical protein
MGRPYRPRDNVIGVTWGDAPGWYGVAPLARRKGAWWGEGEYGASRSRAWSEGGPRTGSCVVLLGTGGTASGSRHAPATNRSSLRDGACGEGRVGWREYGASRSRAGSEGARRRTPCARESCNSDSSPEPAAAGSEGTRAGDVRVWRRGGGIARRRWWP